MPIISKRFKSFVGKITYGKHLKYRPGRKAGQEAVSELQEDILLRAQRKHLFPLAALVGLGAGAVASLFRFLLISADNLRDVVISWSHNIPQLGWIFPLLFSMSCAFLSVVIMLRFAPETSGSGIPHIEAVLRRLKTITWTRVLPVKLVSGVLSIGGGLVLGREGPTVQMGGAVGDAVSRLFKVHPREKRTLIAAGAGSGLAAAFNAPLAGVMFVLEEIQRDFHPLVFGAAFLAAAIADIVVRLPSGSPPVFSIPDYVTPPMSSLPVFVMLGIVTGIFGVLFNKALLKSLNFLGSCCKGARKIHIAAAVGAVIGVAGWFSPLAIGSGHSLSEVILSGKFELSAIPLLFTARFFLTILCYGSGASGGIFTPLLSLGALLGLATGEIAHHFFPGAVPQPAVFAVTGMAAYFTAIVRSPLTGVLLIVEMTGDYQQMLPLLVCCFFAYSTAELMKTPPVYESLLERDLQSDGIHLTFNDPMIFDAGIEENSFFDGKEIRDLGLPPGCLIIRYVEAGKEFVPTAIHNTRGTHAHYGNNST